MKITIQENQIADLVRALPRWRFIAVKFIKANGDLRRALAITGVHNPKNEDIKPRGTGETSREALLKGRFKFYDALKAEYRQARFSGIISISYGGITYIINHA